MFSLDSVHTGANTDSPKKADPLWKGSREGVYIRKKIKIHKCKNTIMKLSILCIC